MSDVDSRRGEPIEGLRIVHEDARVIVVDKPSGLLSQPGRSVVDSVVERVRAARPAASGPMMMHRLDMDTSGLLVLAKDADAHRALGAQFERREVGKTYRARLERPAPGLGGRVALPLRLDVDNRPYQIVCTEFGRPAVTLWRRLPGNDGRDVLFHPLTGRTHQLRVHAADPRGLGCPIAGDRLYGRAEGRLMLHAARLAFVHPGTGRRQVFRSDAPFDDAAASDPSPTEASRS